MEPLTLLALGTAGLLVLKRIAENKEDGVASPTSANDGEGRSNFDYLCNGMQYKAIAAGVQVGYVKCSQVQCLTSDEVKELSMASEAKDQPHV